MLISPLLANIYLHTYEFEFLQSLRKSNAKLARKFSDTFRYIDDLASLNNSLFKQYISSIYPSTLTLLPKNNSPLTATFLDTKISIKHSTFHIQVYDKRDNFPFKINNYPHTCSNIHVGNASNVYIAQLTRLLTICSHLKYFNKRHHLLIHKLLRNGFTQKQLIYKFKTFLHTHSNTLRLKYNIITKDYSYLIKTFFTTNND